MTAIEFENVGKQYRLGLVSTQTLSHDLNRWWTVNVRHKEDPYLRIGETNDRSVKGASDYVWALKDINFKVEQGDVVGIIGRNGAGKSTLLKLLSKVTAPTTGCIRARGRIGSLLEVGTGFHPEMTGRENIYMNGAILGMTKHEISRKLDEIVDFSGCERYLDTPVKRYSSGMMVRLGFAVAAHLDPEILVVDEVLAVGDAEFQKKAIGKMKDVSQGEGRTVLFVSHNINSIRTLCNTGIVLENGEITYSGDIDNAVLHYISDIKNSRDLLLDKIKYYDKDIKINSILINGWETNNVTVSPKENTINIAIKGFTFFRKKIDIEAWMYDQYGTVLGMFSKSHKDGNCPIIEKGDFIIEQTIVLPKNLTTGDFYFQLTLTQPNVECLVGINTMIHVHSEGYASVTGQNYQYSRYGLLIL